MSIELSSEQRQAIAAAGTPLQVVDSSSGNTYVLVRSDVFQRAKSLLGEELAESYPAQIASAMQAGWDEPEMDEYNEYDKHRSK
jgi:hypothetical protein